MRAARRLLGCASVLVCLSGPSFALAAGADPTTATAAQKAEALEHFKNGKGDVAAHRYEAALAEFRAAFDVVASPNAQLLAARCLRDMGKPAEAWTEYGATAANARALETKDASYGKTAETADSERKALEPKIALVTVNVEHATDATKLTAAGASIGRGQWGKPMAFAPGSIDFVVSADDQRIASSTLTVAAGDTNSIALDATPPKPVVADKPAPADEPPTAEDRAGPADQPQPPAPEAPQAPQPSKLRPYAYVAGGVAVAGLVTFAISGALEKGTYSKLQSVCKNGSCPPGHEGDISTGRMQETIANIGLGVGIAGAIAGGVLFVVSMPKSQAAAQTASSAPPPAAIVVGPSFVGVRGTL